MAAEGQRCRAQSSLQVSRTENEQTTLEEKKRSHVQVYYTTSYITLMYGK
jgi:hypothetical protein